MDSLTRIYRDLARELEGRYASEKSSSTYWYGETERLKARLADAETAGAKLQAENDRLRAQLLESLTIEVEEYPMPPDIASIPHMGAVS